MCVYSLFVCVGSFWKIWDCHYCLWCPGVIGQMIFVAHSQCWHVLLFACEQTFGLCIYVQHLGRKGLVLWLKCFLFGAFSRRLNWFNNDTLNNPPQWDLLSLRQCRCPRLSILESVEISKNCKYKNISNSKINEKVSVCVSRYI